MTRVRAWSLNDFLRRQQIQPAGDDAKTVIGRQLQQERDGEFVIVLGQVVEYADGRVAAGDQAMRGRPNAGGLLCHFIPRHAST